MAATVNAWSKPGAWALDSEENDAELQQQQLVAAAAAEVPPSDFPSLASAVSTKTKKKKPQPLSMQEFHNYASAKQVQSPELISLPTGPRERTAEELDRSRLGGGFRSYGSSYDRPDRDDSRRQGSRDFAPSRADETDDWGASKKFSQGNGFERRDRGDRAGAGFFSDSQSRADGSDNWGANKAFVPSDGGRRGFERRGGFESNGGGADSDIWTRKKEDESRKFGSDSEGWGRKREEGSVNTERPRLNLKPRTIPLGEGQMNGNGSPGKPKGSNPFGEARPREEVLREKGQDWKEIEQKLESMKMKDVGKKSFGSSNGRTSPDDITKKSWRKSEENDSSSEKPDGRGEEEYRDGECNEDAEPLRDEK